MKSVAVKQKEGYSERAVRAPDGFAYSSNVAINQRIVSEVRLTSADLTGRFPKSTQSSEEFICNQASLGKSGGDQSIHFRDPSGDLRQVLNFYHFNRQIFGLPFYGWEARR